MVISAHFLRTTIYKSKKDNPNGFPFCFCGIAETRAHDARGHYSRNLYYNPPQSPFGKGGRWGREFSSQPTINNKRKSDDFHLLLRYGRDSSPRCSWAVSRELYLHPQPLRGVFGVASGEARSINDKRIAKGYPYSLSGKRDSNSRPQPWQGCALPTELFPQH